MMLRSQSGKRPMFEHATMADVFLMLQRVGWYDNPDEWTGTVVGKSSDGLVRIEWDSNNPDLTVRGVYHPWQLVPI